MHESLTNWRFAPLAGLTALLLLGCASVSEEECRVGDWRGIGFSDGAAGRSPDYIDNHRKACAKVGVAPDLAAWQAGRSQGLKQYCSPQNAYETGRKGQEIGPYCSAAQVSSMQKAHEFGLKYNELGHEIALMEAEYRDLRRDLSGTVLAGDRAWLSRRINDLRYQINQTRSLQQAFATYPG